VKFIFKYFSKICREVSIIIIIIIIIIIYLLTYVHTNSII